MKEPQLSGIAKALAAQGRHGDDTLVHVSRKELAMLERMGDGIGVHMTKNPQTGLPEAFNWLGTLGGIAGGIIGGVLTAGNPLGVAAGASLGSGAGTAAGGGSLKQSLTAGVISGITGYASAGLAGGLADAGVQATEQTLAQSGGSALGQTGGQSLAEGSSQQLGTVIGDQFVQNGSQALTQTPLQQISQTGGQTLAEGSSKGIGSVIGDKFVTGPVGSGIVDNVSKAPAFVTMNDRVITDPATQMTYGEKLGAGWDKITETPKAFGSFVSDNAKPLITTGLGTLGVGMIQPTETSIVNPDTSSDSGSRYKGETYIDPATGQMRTRAVRLAEGGSFSDYDAADVGSDGGYSPGGGVGYALGGGIAAGSNVTENTAMADFYKESPDDKVINGVNWTQAAKLGTVRPQNGLAKGGGIGDLGSYSDGGRMLRGPGDGVSDSIPASIENKRPARLADGEFVVPARAVSELGNGSTEAGSKQLYAMLDRIAAKRKSGKGLAYNANPKKLLPA